eukprot:TRINITY_DN941_c0_g1_i3.p1 TRINITY_DN941_c0_g1~~TRINITY_DN941_c0_g1_i3.p1  ORF type:complete len:542 (-),score=115.08 TRINITY_DN941_c0_g1_i3:164-1789(-)
MLPGNSGDYLSTGSVSTGSSVSNGSPHHQADATTQQWVRLTNEHQMMWNYPQYAIPEQAQVEMGLGMLDLTNHPALAAITPGSFGTPPITPAQQAGPTGSYEQFGGEILGIETAVGASSAGATGSPVKYESLAQPMSIPSAVPPAPLVNPKPASRSKEPASSAGMSRSSTQTSLEPDSDNVSGLRAIKTSFVTCCIQVVLNSSVHPDLAQMPGNAASAGGGGSSGGAGKDKDLVFEFQDYVRLAFEQVVPPPYRGNVDAQLGRAISDALLSHIFRYLLRGAESTGPVSYDAKQHLRAKAKAIRSKLQKTSSVKIGDISMPKRIFACVRLRQPILEPTGNQVYDDAVRHLLSLSNNRDHLQFDSRKLEDAMYVRWENALQRKREANRREREAQEASRGRRSGARSDTSTGSLKRSRVSESGEYARRSTSPFRVKAGMLMPMKVQDTGTKFIVQVWCPGQAPGSVNVRTSPMSIRLWGTLKDTEYFDPNGSFVFDEGGEVDWVRTYDFPAPVVPTSTRILASNNGLAVAVVDKVLEETHTIVG